MSLFIVQKLIFRLVENRKFTMSFEFNFLVRDGLKAFLSAEDFNKLELRSSFPRRTHPKEVLLDIITYCSLGDIEQGKLNVVETIKLMDTASRAFVVQNLVWHFWRKSFMKTKLTIEKKPEEIESCKNFHERLKGYREMLSAYNGFNWTWYVHFIQEIHNFKEECKAMRDESELLE